MPRERLDKQADDDDRINTGKGNHQHPAPAKAGDKQPRERHDLLGVKPHEVGNPQVAHGP